MTVYIRPSERDTRYALWHIPYQCRVPYIQSMSIEELSRKGIYVSGVPAYDHATAWEPRLMSLSVVRMVEMWHNGANIHLVDADKHVRTIYEDIQKHLSAWTEHLNVTYNVRNYPEEELKLLDDFNAMMYEHAKWIDKKTTWDGLLTSRAAVPSIATFSAFWEKRDKIKAEEERTAPSRMGERYKTKSGLEFIADPASKAAEVARLSSMDHAGKEAIDVHPARTSWSELMDQYKR